MNTTQAAGWALIALVSTAVVSTEIKRAIAQPSHNSSAAHTMSTPHAAAAYAHAAMQQRAGQGRYGLVQTGIVGVAHLGPTGTFGQPTPMPIFHMVQLQAPKMHPTAARMNPPIGPAAAQAHSAQQPTRSTPTPNSDVDQASAEPDLPPGITIAPQVTAQPAGTWCTINSVAVLTQTADACRTAGGSVTSN